MVTVGVFTAPPDAFVFGRLFERYPDASMEIERVIPTGEAVAPYVWVEGVDGAAMRATLATTHGVDHVAVVDTFDHRSLLRCHCRNSACELLDAMATLDLTVLSATGTAEGWQLTLRENVPGELSAFNDHCRRIGIAVELRDIRAFGGPAGRGLTEPQYEALRLAYERGYYAEPRETTLEDIAGELGISRQALASRLRRGYRWLIRTQLPADV